MKTDIEVLQDALRVLAAVRSNYDQATYQIKELKTRFEASPKYKRLSEWRNECNNNAVMLKDTVVKLTVQIYENDPTNKKITAGASIQMRTVVEYDEAVALAWATDSKLKYLIVPAALDKAKFESFVIKNPGMEIPGVTTRLVPAGVVATDLSALLIGDGDGQSEEPATDPGISG